jgi:hypothetical protein
MLNDMSFQVFQIGQSCEHTNQRQRDVSWMAVTRLMRLAAWLD